MMIVIAPMGTTRVRMMALMVLAMMIAVMIVMTMVNAECNGADDECTHDGAYGVGNDESDGDYDDHGKF